MNAGFLAINLWMFYQSRRTFRFIFDSGKGLPYGFYALLVPALGYTLFYVMAYLAGGSPSTFKPWLALPIEEYFKYDIVLALPGNYLSWIGAAGTVYLISRLLKGKGGFDQVLAIIGFGVGVATWSSLFHDLTDALLSVLGVIDMREYERLLNEPTFWRALLLTLYAIYFFWILTLFTLGIRLAQRLGWARSVVVAFIGLATFQVILLIFIR